MGKASRKKHDRKIEGKGLIADNALWVGKSTRDGSDSPVSKMVSIAARNAIVDALDADDVDSLEEWIEVFEQAAGMSIFDQVCAFKNQGHAEVHGSVIHLANLKLAGKCTAFLFLLASKRGHDAAGTWMNGALLRIETLPKIHQGNEFLTHVFEGLFKPNDREDAEDTLAKVGSGLYPPQLTAIAKRVALKCIAECERGELEEAIGSNHEAVRGMRVRI